MPGSLATQVFAVEEAPFASDPNFHREREETYVILLGRGQARVGTSEALPEASDLVCTTPGEAHQFIAAADAPLRYLVITAPSWSPTDSHHYR